MSNLPPGCTDAMIDAALECSVAYQRGRDAAEAGRERCENPWNACPPCIEWDDWDTGFADWQQEQDAKQEQEGG